MKNERELFELTDIFKERCDGLVFNNGKYEFVKDIGGLSQMEMAILGLNLTVVNSAWSGWQAYTQREGFRFVPVDTLNECLNWASVARWDSPSKERDIEIDCHVGIIEAAIGTADEQ